LAQLRAFQKTARAATSPDGWIESLYRLEAIAALARQMDDLAFAEEAAKVLNEHDQMYPGAYFAQAFVAEKKGNVTEAKKMYAEAVKGWARADSKFAGKQQALKKAAF
jgi:hypothetical protein